jgi:hypothetical protein
MEKLEYYQYKVDEDITNDSDRDNYLEQFDDILNIDWDLPKNLQALPWMRAMKTSAAADGIDSAIRTFSTVLPTLHVHGNNSGAPERQRAKDIEDALMWHFIKANQRGIRRPLELLNDSVIKYGVGAMQVRYLPYDFKGKEGTNRYKILRSQGDFAYIVHKPHDVHARISGYGLESVSVRRKMSIDAAVKEFGAENPGIKALLALYDGQDNPPLATTMVYFFDYTDYDVRAQWISESDSPIAGDKYQIVLEEHGLPFLPFIYRESNKPMMKVLVDSGAVENQNVLKSLQYALLVATVAQARTTSYTYNAEGIPTDYTNPGGQNKAHVGEQVTQNPPAQTDPNLAAQVVDGDNTISRQLNTRAFQLASEMASSMPFATFNAVMQAAASSLSLQRQTSEAIWEDAFIHQLYWINFSDVPLVGQRPRNRTGYSINASLAQGAQVAIGNGTDIQFDPTALTVSVKLRADTPTDEQARINKAVLLHTQLNFSIDDSLEAAGLDELERSNESYVMEKFAEAVVQSKQQEIISSAQIRVQQAAQMQMQAQQQQHQPAQTDQQSPDQQIQDMNQGGSFDSAQGQAYNPAQGGASPYQAAPGMTREAINGKSNWLG